MVIAGQDVAKPRMPDLIGKLHHTRSLTIDMSVPVLINAVCHRIGCRDCSHAHYTSRAAFRHRGRCLPLAELYHVCPSFPACREQPLQVKRRARYELGQQPACMPRDGPLTCGSRAAAQIHWQRGRNQGVGISRYDGRPEMSDSAGDSACSPTSAVR